MDNKQNREIAIHINHLIKNYGKKEVIKDISLDVYKGELLGFIGKNGVGKSTTIECMLGIKAFNSGEIEILGHSIKKDPIKVKEELGYVSSEPMAYEDMTGYSYVEFIASIYRIKQEIFVKNFQYLSRRLDLQGDDLYRPIKEYSHGMKQKICLIASLIHNPKIWILDEPTVGLDAFTANELTKMIKEYVSHGNTCFIASHNIELISRLCDRVAIINEGKILKIFDLINEPRSRRLLPQYFLEKCKETSDGN